MDNYEKALEILKDYDEDTEEVKTFNKNLYMKKEEQKEYITSIFILIIEYSSFQRFLLFKKWLFEHDSVFPKLDIHFYSNDHRGVVAKRNIYKDEIILRIPKECLISLEMAKETPIGRVLASFMYDLNSPKHCLLSSFLLQELHNPNSKWKHYIDILPKDYTNFPIFFTDEELKLFTGSPFLANIFEKRDDIRRDYEHICKRISEFEKYSFKEFCEMRMAVSSRIFCVKIEGRKTDVLAPMADLLNHKRPRQTHWVYDENHKSFIITALENIKEGEEVSIA
jgi:histone-lysine N-methyltransferase SETD3